MGKNGGRTMVRFSLPHLHGRLPGELRCHDPESPADFAVGGIQVKARAIPHIGHTLGFRIEARGRSLAYISDHQAPLDRHTVEKNVFELCEGADLVLDDAQYTDEEFATMSDWGHSTDSYAVRVAVESGARASCCSTTIRPTPTTR